MIGLLLNNELERAWKKAVVTNFRYHLGVSGETDSVHENFNQDNR
jgi:hypothetical protein